jgi:hypothetical protein
VWQRTGDPKYFAYIKQDLDQFVRADGSIRTYEPADFNLDDLTPGHALLLLSQVLQPGNEKYRKAAQYLRKQLDGQPRTKEGGFWYQKIYPNQLWLDGLYMAEPFYAEYSQVYQQPAGFDDVAKQFTLIEKHLVDPKTGLLYHGYDESKAQALANKTTDQSVNMVQGSQFAQGKVDLTSGKAVFEKATTAYVKELSVLALTTLPGTAPAQPLVANNGKVIMATARLGKGRVFVLGDPWLYNEYTDGRKIPASFENFQAGKDLATWLLHTK